MRSNVRPDDKDSREIKYEGKMIEEDSMEDRRKIRKKMKKEEIERNHTKGIQQRKKTRQNEKNKKIKLMKRGEIHIKNPLKKKISR